jgi:hypothetical protein
VPSASCCFLLVFAFSENHYQKVSRQEKNFGLIFSRPEETHEASREDQKSHEEATSLEGIPNISNIPERQTRKLFRHRKPLFFHDPSRGLFRQSAGGGIDHGGLLRQPCYPSDDV